VSGGAARFGFRSWAGTHPGARRTLNEDKYLDRPDLGLWAVADGAGGREAGEVASGMLTETLGAIPGGLGDGALAEEIGRRVALVHARLRAEAARRGEGAVIAATLVALAVCEDRFALLWAGDARAYLLRGGRLAQLSRDHSLVQALIGEGRITPAEAASYPRGDVVTRAVGAEIEAFALEKASGRLEAGDRFLLCSDGIWKTLMPDELRALLGAPEGVPPDELLLAAALAREASDNITAVAIEVRPAG